MWGVGNDFVCVELEIGMALVRRVATDWVFVLRPIMTWFSRGTKVSLVFVCGLKMT